MFVRGMRGLKGLGDFNVYTWKEENWFKPAGAAAPSVIPGVSNTTAAVAGGGLGLAALAAAAWWFFGRK